MGSEHQPGDWCCSHITSLLIKIVFLSSGCEEKLITTFSFIKNEEVSRWKTHIQEHMENDILTFMEVFVKSAEGECMWTHSNDDVM